MDKEIKLCVTLTDEVKSRLKYYYDTRRQEELTRMALSEANKTVDFIMSFKDNEQEDIAR